MPPPTPDDAGSSREECHTDTSGTCAQTCKEGAIALRRQQGETADEPPEHARKRRKRGQRTKPQHRGRQGARHQAGPPRGARAAEPGCPPHLAGGEAAGVRTGQTSRGTAPGQEGGRREEAAPLHRTLVERPSWVGVPASNQCRRATRPRIHEADLLGQPPGKARWAVGRRLGRGEDGPEQEAKLPESWHSCWCLSTRCHARDTGQRSQSKPTAGTVQGRLTATPPTTNGQQVGWRPEGLFLVPGRNGEQSTCWTCMSMVSGP